MSLILHDTGAANLLQTTWKPRTSWLRSGSVLAPPLCLLLLYLTGGLDAEHGHSRLRVTLELVHQPNPFRGRDTAVNPYVTSLTQKKERTLSVRQRANRPASVSGARENLAKQAPARKAEAVVIPTMEPLCDWHVWSVCLLSSTAALRILQQWFLAYQRNLQQRCLQLQLETYDLPEAKGCRLRGSSEHSDVCSVLLGIERDKWRELCSGHRNFKLVLLLQGLMAT